MLPRWLVLRVLITLLSPGPGRVIRNMLGWSLDVLQQSNAHCKLGRPQRILRHCKISIFRNASNLCTISAIFCTGIASFTLLQKVCFAGQKLHCCGYFRPHLGAVNFVQWNCKTKQCKTHRMSTDGPVAERERGPEPFFVSDRKRKKQRTSAARLLQSRGILERRVPQPIRLRQVTARRRGSTAEKRYRSPEGLGGSAFLSNVHTLKTNWTGTNALLVRSEDHHRRGGGGGGEEGTSTSAFRPYPRATLHTEWPAPLVTACSVNNVRFP